MFIPTRILDRNGLPARTPDPCRVRILKKASGEPNLQVLGENGKWITYYSRVDVSRELELFLERTKLPEGRPILLLGLGLGYHLLALLKKTSDPVIVVERSREILEAALTMGWLTEAVEKENVHLVTGKDPEQVLGEISRIQVQSGLEDLFLVEHRPSVRAFSSFYQPIEERFQTPKKVKMGNRLAYEKFRKERLNILLINSQYLLMGELVNGLRALGHNVRPLLIEREAEVAGSEFIESLLRTLLEFQPDFILTVNHLGFDREGIMTALLTDLKIPFASWYVDSPTLIIGHYCRNVSPYCAVFLWDRDYVSEMRTLGFSRVEYLPLGTDPALFSPVAAEKNPLRHQGNRVSFVGNSMVNKIRKRMEKLRIEIQDRPFIEDLGREFAWSGSRNVAAFLNQASHREAPLVQSMENSKRVDFETLIMWQATQSYRLQFIRMLEPFEPTIRGDDGWRNLLGGSYLIGPELSYYTDLNFFYNVCQINFNVTSTQMRNAVNQRVFDVPASGGFLLTDYKLQMEDLLKIGDEVVCFREKEEIPELVKFYLRQGGLREEIARRGRKRVLSEHTYAHRLQRLCNFMRKEFDGA